MAPSDEDDARIPSADVPQAATKLGRVRAALAALAVGASSPDSIAKRARMKVRHAHYQLAAARALGWAERNSPRAHTITARGAALLATTPGSAEERALFVDAVRASSLVARLAEGVDVDAPDAELAITANIQRLTRPPLALETARERARTIAAWLRQAASPQRALRYR